MFDLDNWAEIWNVITRNKFRSILTGFGVFWGIFMLVGLIAIGNGFKGGIDKLVDGVEENTCFFAASITSEAYKGYQKGRSWQMKIKDVDLIRNKAQSVKEISPVLADLSSFKNVVRNNKSGSFGIRGVYPIHFSIEKQNLLQGRFFNETDNEFTQKVCIIGKEVYEAMFDEGEDPIGERIKIKGIYYTVVGVISPVAKISLGGDAELTIFIPFSTMQLTFQKNNVVHYIACTTNPGYTAEMVEDEVKGLLQKAHNISPTDEKAIGCFNVEREFLIFRNLFDGTDILTWIVGLGSLFSGIIGVSNIMLVTVRERTHEIGIKRAIGASPYVIVRQVVVESFLLTVIFGIFGLLAGVVLLEVVDYEMSKHALEDLLFIPPFVEFYKAIYALVALCVAGLLAGLIPSMRAISIKAIDAIREE